MTAEPPRAVVDTMVMFQWVALAPTRRTHATEQALQDRRLVQCLSQELFEEIHGLLLRPKIRAKSPHLTAERVNQFVSRLRDRCQWVDPVPARFSLPAHPKDDHVFNLAIEAQADYLVTWETRLLNLSSKHPDAAAELSRLAPELRIVTPQALSQTLAQGPVRSPRQGPSPGA